MIPRLRLEHPGWAVREGTARNHWAVVSCRQRYSRILRDEQRMNRLSIGPSTSTVSLEWTTKTPCINSAVCKVRSRLTTTHTQSYPSNKSTAQSSTKHSAYNQLFISNGRMCQTVLSQGKFLSNHSNQNLSPKNRYRIEFLVLSEGYQRSRWKLPTIIFPNSSLVVLRIVFKDCVEVHRLVRWTAPPWAVNGLFKTSTLESIRLSPQTITREVSPF